MGVSFNGGFFRHKKMIIPREGITEYYNEKGDRIYST